MYKHLLMEYVERKEPDNSQVDAPAKPVAKHTIFLKDIPVKDTIRKVAHQLIGRSNHRISWDRIALLSNWIAHSPDPVVARKFIEKNIDNKYFYPFANPWKKNEMSDLYEATKGTKIIRLSTRAGGMLTLSHIKGLQHSRRLKISARGIHLGNYVFDGITELIDHLDKNECCVCMETTSSGTSIILECGHTFHQDCLGDGVKIKCPFCRCRQSVFVGMAPGYTSVYAQHDW